MSVNELITEILNKTPGILSITVSDRDGVEIVSAPSDTLNSADTRRNSQILSTIFNLTHQQCEKLPEFSKTDYIMSEFGSTLMLQAEYSPITISMRADKTRVCEGQLLGALSQTRKVFDSLKDQIAAVVS